VQRRRFIGLWGSVAVGAAIGGCTDEDAPGLEVSNHWEPGIRFTVDVEHLGSDNSIHKEGTIPDVERSKSIVSYDDVFRWDGMYEVVATARDLTAKKRVEHPGDGIIVVSLYPSKIDISWVGP